MRTLAPPPNLARWGQVDTGPFAFGRRTSARQARGTEDFRAWNERVSPAFRWDWRHLVVLQETLERVRRGELRKVIVQMPPRHGKSECGTIRFPAYCLAHRPETRVIIGAYNATLATKFARKARRIAQAAGVALSTERAAADDWETTAGGGVRAAGVGSGVTGHGADLILIDDPVKSREEAESETYRDKVWDWYKDDLYTRREPGAAIVLTMTRWHEDDLAGRLQANMAEDAHEWHVINFPALAGDNDPLGRQPGEALCPDRFDAAALADIERTLGGYSFAALYQGSPTPRSGGMFPREAVTIVDAVPAHATRRVRYWDMAATEDGGDWTVGVRMSVADGVYYVEHVARARLGSAARDRFVKQTAEMDGRAVRQKREQEPGASGKDQAAAFVRLLAGWPVSAAPASGDKVVRADPFSAQWQAGNVRLVRGDWNEPYLRVMESFPNGKHDDDVDASSGAFNEIAGGRRVWVA